jgi:hypothetical protein
MVAQVRETPIPPLDIEPSIGLELNEIVIKAIAKDSAHRYRSARELLDALQPFAKESMGPVRSQPAARHNYFARASLAAIAVATFVLAFTGGLGRRSLEPHLPLPAPPAPRSSFDIPVQPARAQTVSSSSPEASRATPTKHRRPILRQRPAEEATNAQPDDKNPKPLADVENATPVEETSAAPLDTSDTSEITNELVAADQQPVSPSHKKRFWNRLNPFRRKKADPDYQKSFIDR